MSITDLILIVLVGAGAFYAGYQVGRFKALAERGGGRAPPLGGPLEAPYAEAQDRHDIPRGPAAPASDGSDGGWSGRRAPPRRSSKPPPAAAGLMGSGTAEKPSAGQK